MENFNLENYVEVTDQRFGTMIFFDKDSVYGTIAVPETGNIHLNLSKSKLGVTALIIHNSAVPPTFSGEFELRNGNYQPSTINYIICTFINPSKIIYTIL